jgi:hypothetical protein
MINKYINPFEYEPATKLDVEQVIKYYIEDFNYSRFIFSRRNIFLVGERGTGKTMSFLYYSLPVQYLKVANSREKIDLSIISVYIPCNTPLVHRREHELLDNLNASLVSEHFFVVSIMASIVSTLLKIVKLMSQREEIKFRAEMEYILGIELLKDAPTLQALLIALDRANVNAQEALNSDNKETIYKLISFSSGLRPLLSSLSRIPKLKNSHYSLMIDDAQLLNQYQISALNSWIAYRDNELFSFKIATTRVEAPSLLTSSGGNILEGHDFTKIEMEQPYQNKLSSFGKLARQIITRRLKTIGINNSPEEFFPINQQFIEDIESAEKQAKLEAQEKYKNGTTKQIDDYVYKYKRAIYFRDRSKRANLPPYTGFELLIHLSTGVIRNLLDPPYHMFDRMYSEMHAANGGGTVIVDKIPPNIQDEIIKERSKIKWEWIKNDLDNTIEGCSREEAQRVYRLMDNLAILFKKRLLANISEPRAVVFTISGYEQVKHSELDKILLLSRKAQMLYVFTSSAKDSGKRETYYMPNRILWPQRGLDAQGQHARVSIMADHLLNSIKSNTEIPFKGDEQDDEPNLFDQTD